MAVPSKTVPFITDIAKFFIPGSHPMTIKVGSLNDFSRILMCIAYVDSI